MSKILTEFQEDLQPLLEDYLRANSEYWKEYQDQFRELFDKDFYQKQREEIMSTGYVVDSLKASLWCLGTTETFEGAALISEMTPIRLVASQEALLELSINWKVFQINGDNNW